MLPKSLHTVRIIVAVAEYLIAAGTEHRSQPRAAVFHAATICGYPTGKTLDDPLIVKAIAQVEAREPQA